ncbi:MAG: SpoIID/LytB domain-containing protein [Kovacikia sp.]
MRLQLEKHPILQAIYDRKNWLFPLIFTLLLLPIALAKSLSLTSQPTQLQVNLGLSGSEQLIPKSNQKPAQKPSGGKAKKQQPKQSSKQKTQSPAAAPPAPAPGESGQLDMLVEIAKGSSQLGISTSTPGAILDDSGRPLRAVQQMQAIYAEPGDRGINLSSWQAPPSFWVEATQGGYVFIGSRWYRGRVRIILQNDGLLAVNQVGLEDYLVSVVGSEMYSHWPLEALKAQAVAARSYALARYVQPPSDYYHIGSDEAYQVYKGLETETGSTRSAVQATSSQILSYKGGIVDSTYAASDDIVITAHGGRGMSQQGAFKLASQGYDYLHILGNYYPGAGLARLQLAGK